MNFGLAQIKKFILDLIFPIECLGCGREEVWVCDRCLEAIPCRVQFVQNKYLDRVLVCGSYDNELLKKLIHTFKYSYVEDLVVPLGRLTQKTIAKASLPENFLLVPVPLHKKRLKERGFNQAELLAGELAQRLGKEVIDVLHRSRHTDSQVDLKEKERQKNVQGAFTCLEHLKVKNQNIILVDDVLTTGATMEECARILRENDAGEVWGLVLAKG